LDFCHIASSRARQFQVSEPNNVPHSKWVDYLSEHYNKSGMRVLEIGSRVVNGTRYPLPKD